MGLIISTELPAVQAKLSDADTAKATATWQFVRNFGLVFGSAIPASVFNTRSGQPPSIIREPAIRNRISSGHAYEHATRAFVLSVPITDGLRQQVNAFFTDALKLTWQVGIAFAGIGVFLVFLEEQVELCKDLKVITCICAIILFEVRFPMSRSQILRWQQDGGR